MLLKGWELLEAVAKAAREILIISLPGMGKSYWAAKLAKKLGKKLIHITFTDDMAVGTLTGYYMPDGHGGAKWHDGVLTRAWKEGALLAADEIDKVRGDVETILHAFLDSRASASFTLENGETVYPAPSFQVVATMNGEADDLSPALLSRFPVRLTMDEPNPDAIEALPEDLRKAAKGSVMADDSNRRVDLRRWFAFATLRSSIGADVAASAVFGERAQEVLDALTLNAESR